MIKQAKPLSLSKLSAICVLSGIGLNNYSLAQEEEVELEEVVVVGRLKSSAQSLVQERVEQPFSADFLGFEMMSQAGDPNLAAALRRVPGLTVVDGKFVYVRGLGERYSSVTVNGASVPSPDLTRSVIPLDLFPTTIVDSIKIQKSPSPDQPAAFGGGAIDIRTKTIPDDFVAAVSVGTGIDSESNDRGLLFAGNGSSLSPEIHSAISQYRGDISVSNILSALKKQNGSANLAEAQTIHQGLMDSIDTNVGIDKKSLDPDMDAKISLGNSFYLGDDWKIGALANATYNKKYRNKNQRREGVGDPIGNVVDIKRTAEEESILGSINAGLTFKDIHLVNMGYYILKNDEAEASIGRGFDQNNEYPDQKISYSTRLEERELELLQFTGQHAVEETPWLDGFASRLNLDGLEFEWFYSDATASTNIPNESDFQASALLDSDGSVLKSQILATTSSGKFSFLELEDSQTSWGGKFELPWYTDTTEFTASAGWWGSEKAREYLGYNVNLNSVGVQSSFLTGTPATVLAERNLQVGNGFDVSLGSNFGTESYLAAQKINALFGSTDFIFDSTWRVTVGVRYEEYQQVALPYDLLDFTGNSVRNIQDELSSQNQRLAIQTDDIYLSGALTYIGADLFGAEEYQIRFSYGQTVVRADLREIADVVYLDPELDIRVRGNPGVETSDIDNFELRSEYFYDSGDNFTVSIFYKDIAAPIERIRAAGSDDDVVLSFVNAQSGEVYGVELEGLKDLGRGFFVQGNLTLSDSELDIDTVLATNLTHDNRRLTGHSQYVANVTLGLDSDNGQHSAYLNYNVFGERVYFAGSAGNDEAFEQPFHSLGLVYKYYPVDTVELTFKADNIFGENKVFEQRSRRGLTATIIEQEVGTSINLSAKWRF